MEKNKKRAPSALTLEAGRTTGKHINTSLPRNSTIVKDELLEEIEEIFVQLSPERQRHIIEWATLYFKDPNFKEAFNDCFGDDLEDCIFQEVEDFVSAWKAVAV